MPNRVRYPLWKDGKAIVKVQSAMAKKHLESLLGYLPQGYVHFKKSGDWREVPKERVAEAIQIPGIKGAFWEPELYPVTEIQQ